MFLPIKKGVLTYFLRHSPKKHVLFLYISIITLNLLEEFVNQNINEKIQAQEHQNN